MLTSMSTSNEYEVKYYLDNRISNKSHTLSKSPINNPTNYFKNLIRQLSKNKPFVISQYVDIICSITNNEKLRQRVKFINGSEQAPFKEHMIKRTTSTIIRNNDYGGYKISSAVENLVKKYEIRDRQISLVRLCVRYSIKIDDIKVEITLIKNSNINNMKLDRESFIYPMSSSIDDDSLSEAPFDKCDWIECEIEFPSSIDFKNAELQYNILLRQIDHTYNLMMADIAYLIGNNNYNRFREFWHFKTWGFNKLLSKAKEISKKEWIEHFDILDMSIRLKIKGERHIIYIDERTKNIISLNNINFNIIGSINGSINNSVNGPFVFDCELYNNIYYILHPLVWNGETLWDKEDSVRLNYMKSNLNSAPDFIINGMQLCPLLMLDPKLHIKKQIVKFQTSLKSKFESDGLLPASKDGSYWDQTFIKWKDAKDSTFDFMITLCPEQLMGKKPYVLDSKENKLYILWCYISKDDFNKYRKKYLLGQDKIFGKCNLGKTFPTIFDPIDAPLAYLYESDVDNLHGKIGEFLRSKNSWTLCKLRDDKKSILEDGNDMGNYYTVGMDIWSKINDPFTLDHLSHSKVNENDTINSDAHNDEHNDEHNVYNHILSYIDINVCKYVVLYDTPINNLNSIYSNIDHKILVVQSNTLKVNFESINNMNVMHETHLVKFNNLKTDIPPLFIGGGDVVICMNNDIDSIKKINDWTKSVLLLIKHGGKFIYADKSNTIDKFKNEFAKLNIKRVDHIEFEDWNIYIYERLYDGEINMTGAIISRENIHLKSVYSNNMEKVYDMNLIKYARQKTKDCIPVPKSHVDLSSLKQNIDLGYLLCDIEFIAQHRADIQLYYQGQCKWKHILRILFPKLKWVNEPNHDNVELFISHDLDYKSNIESIKAFMPTSSLLKIDIASMPKKIVKVLQGKMLFIPYQIIYDTHIMMQFTKPNFDAKWHIRPAEFEKEMNYFHQTIRTSCYHYKKTICKLYNFDCCYDCKCMNNILHSYLRNKESKNSDIITYDNILKIILS
jgi:hypothetical protein